MKKVLCIFLALVLIIGCFTGCGKKKGTDSETPLEEETAAVKNLPTASEVESLLRKEAYPATSVLMTMVGNVVTYSDFTIDEDTITFTMSAPHVGEDLIDWYDSIDVLNDGDLEDTFAKLLDAAEPADTTFSLSYRYIGNTIALQYTNEYLNIAGCGIREYYAHIYNAVLAEMEAAV